MPATTIDLIRHGEPVGGSKYRGQSDDPLSAKGWAQMRAAVAGRDEWDAVVSSDLCRCADFAREVAGRLGLPLELEAGLREVGFGAWEGLTAAEILARDEAGLTAFWADPVRCTPPGGEPLSAFRERVTAAWEGVTARHRGRRVLLVGHAGMMRIVLLHALGLPLDAFYRFEIGNAALLRLRVSDGRHGTAFTQLLLPGPTVEVA